MPGFFGLITDKGIFDSYKDKFHIISRNIFTNTWNSYKHACFSQSNHQVALGVVSLYSLQTKLLLTQKTPMIFFEGYVYEIEGISSVPKDYNKIQNLLKDLYLNEGYQILNKIYGSFSMIIIDSDSLSLITDHTASRPIYVYRSEGILAWSPEIVPLIKAFKENLSLNIRNLGQILCSEFSFIDDTIVNEIICLRPGEIFTYQKGRIERNFYFKFHYNENNFKSGLYKNKSLTEKIKERIQDIISKQWAMAPYPAIMLSGGLDSRYIVSAIAEAVNDTSKLNLVTWSTPHSKLYSDLDIAGKIAKRLGANHIILERKTDRIVDELDKVFQLIGCEVDSFFHVNERSLIEELRERHGIESIFRGEEAFGWGECRRNLKYALNQIIVSYPEDNPALKSIFQPDIYEQMIRLWHLRLDEILVEYHQDSINDIKDSLYFNWRLPRYLDTLSYFKLAYMELYNPLLDPGILKINSNTPSKLRIEKKILQKAYKTKTGPFNGIPFATRNNLEDWEHVIRTNKKVFYYVKDNLSIEDGIFQNGWGILDDFLCRSINQIDENGSFRDYYKYNPHLRQNPLFKFVKKLRHLFVKPPPETVPVKLIFRAALIKDFITRYLH